MHLLFMKYQTHVVAFDRFSALTGHLRELWDVYWATRLKVYINQSVQGASPAPLAGKKKKTDNNYR